MGRFGRSFRLVGTSYRVLMKDKELLVLPLISGLCILALVAAFAFGMGIPDRIHHDAVSSRENDATYYVPLFLFYVASYTVGFFFQAAMVAGASERLAGGNPTLSSALGAAGRRFGEILLWGLLAGTVGMILRAIQERSGLLGRIVAGIAGIAWSLATFFMVPVLVMERESLGASFKRSTQLFKQTWGETVIGSGALGLVFFLVILLIGGAGVALVAIGFTLQGVALMVLGIAFAAVFFSALNAVYLASLYRYATTGQVAEGFDRDDLTGAFRPKGRR